jgi:uncharacterized protein YbaR (Trm112 family)
MELKVNQMISEELCTILACPACKGDLEPNAGRSALFCRHCSLAFPIRDGIPVMLVDQVERIS